MKMKKINPMQIGKTMIAAGAGAYVGEMVSEKVMSMVDSDIAETGVLLIGSAIGAYIEDSQGGMIGSVGAGLSAEMVQMVIKKYVGGGSEEAAKVGPDGKPVKGVEDEIGEIYDEISKALEVNGTNQPLITGTNEPVIMGMGDDDDN